MLETNVSYFTTNLCIKLIAIQCILENKGILLVYIASRYLFLCLKIVYAFKYHFYLGESLVPDFALLSILFMCVGVCARE